MEQVRPVPAAYDAPLVAPLRRSARSGWTPTAAYGHDRDSPLSTCLARRL